MASAGRRIQLVVYLVLIVTGIVVCAWYGPGQLGEARATASWPAVKGVVVEARAVSQSGRRGRRSHSVRISYTYKVADDTYTGDRYSVAGNLGAGSQEQAEQLARGYRRGDEIWVYYDPASPERAVLLRGGVRKAWLTIGFGALLLVIGLGMGAWRLLRA